ncbi:MAG: hypothetical protein RIK87_24990 [Fuerstiella sp.]
MRAIGILGDKARLILPTDGEFDLTRYEHVSDAILAIITRHPMREEEIVRTLDRWSSDRVQCALQKLVARGDAQPIERFDTRFWSCADAQYVEPRTSVAEIARFAHGCSDSIEE